MDQRTKIGATLGPSCEGKILERILKEGVNFVRLNFSHGTYKKHEEMIRAVRGLEKKISKYIAIIQDLQGPKIRLGELPQEGIEVKKGSIIIFNTAHNQYKKNELPLAYRGLEKVLHSGEKILIDDGRIEVKVERIHSTRIIARVEGPGIITSHKGLNFPDTIFSIPALSVKDKQDILFGIKQGVDYIALSFVKKVSDIIELQRFLRKYQKKSAPVAIIAKIERPEAIHNLEEIVKVSDGIMVARGDLGLEMPEEELPILQKRIVETARRYQKPVMVATQLLDSMRENKRPTRAELSDVANAVIDHADSLLLTNETAVGKFPVITVKTLKKIIITTEKSHYDDVQITSTNQESAGPSVERVLIELSQLLSTEKSNIKALITYSMDGFFARLISHAHPELPLIVGVPTSRLARQLSIVWGVRSFVHVPVKVKFLEKWLAVSFKYLKDNKIAKKHDKVVIIAAEQFSGENKTFIEIKKLN